RPRASQRGAGGRGRGSGPPAEGAAMNASPDAGPGLILARFNSRFDTHPKRVEIAWPELRDVLTNHREREDKDGALWSPTLYRDGAKRGNAGVDKLFALVIDFDDGTAPTAMTPAWERWEYVIYSTFSSTLEHPKWRAVFPLARPVPGVDWTHV